MNNKIWYDYFLKTLYKKYPKNSQLTRELMDLLSIEREAVYRRLRKDVIFSIHEIAKIASAWEISMDEIFSINSGKIPFLMRTMNYITPSEEELKFQQHVIQSINNLKDSPDTEFMNICNKLPRSLIAGFKYLNQFYLFKCSYQHGNGKEVIPFSQIIISKKESRLTADYYLAIKNVPNTNFIFDQDLFDHLVCDIRYFHSIQMITSEEKEYLKKDLQALLNYLSEVATKGYYPETQNKVNLYISQLNIDTNYSYVYTNLANICFIHVFDKHEIYTYNPEMVSNFRKWVQLKKRTSIQISEVDEKSRIEYLTKQRQLIDTL